MRIGVDIRTLSWRASGISRYLGNILNPIVDQHPHDTFFFYSNRSVEVGRYVRDASSITVRTAAMPLPVYKQIVTPFWVWRDKLDVYYSVTPDVPFVRFCKAVSTVHDVGSSILSFRYSIPIRLYNALGLTRLGARLSHVIITDSWVSREDIARVYRLGDTSKIKVVYLACDEFRQSVDDRKIAEVKRRYGLPDKYVFYIDAFCIRKTLQAFSRVRKALNDDLVLVIRTGAHSGDCDIQKESKALGISRHVVWIKESVSSETLAALYSGATVFVFPTLYEGFGLPVIEAMACGTAVISSNRSCIPEVAGGAALLVDPEDANALAHAMTSILTDESRRQALVAAGLRRAADFSWLKTAEGVYRCLHEAVHGVDSNI